MWQLTDADGSFSIVCDCAYTQQYHRNHCRYFGLPRSNKNKQKVYHSLLPFHWGVVFLFCGGATRALCAHQRERDMRGGRKGAAQKQESSALLPSYLVDLGICEAPPQFSAGKIARHE